ncbi:MAG: diaminopimelate epimerase [Gammaproteobacteria bacterium]|nr:diaminopimelate epimerase [Gammaproteobacteria bacterium]
MKIAFTKMQGLGNDFVVIDAIHQSFHLSPEQVRFIADRHRGVGCDQVLLVEPPDSDEVDFRYRIYNQDGGEVGQCGNGARCFARFVVDNHLTDKTEIVVKTASGVIRPRLEADGQVTVDMGVPNFAPQSLPFEANVESDRYKLALIDGEVEIGAVSMGNPHAVVQVEDVDAAPVSSWGPAIEGHPRFPQRVNVGFMQVLSRAQLRLRVYERGAGETQACGTGACAAMAVAHQWGMVDDAVTVQLPGGELLIRWAGGRSPLLMTGPAQTVFEGTIDLG